jgi:Fur family ferric uptake transcriptional regulator
MNLDLTLSSLQDKGHRITKVRKEVVKIFSQSSQPLSANQVEKMLSQVNVTANKATIYRELQFLLTNRYLTEVYLHPNEVSYESSELKHHHHLVCDICGSIDNVTNCLVSKLEEDVLKKKGFQIERHMLEFYGTCSRCLKQT